MIQWTATDRQTCLREIAHYSAVVARIEARPDPTPAQRDALVTARTRLRDERAALVTLARLESGLAVTATA